MAAMRLSLAIIIAIILVAACGDPTPPTESGLKTYRHAMAGAATSIDPAQASSIYANFLVINAYDTLYRYKYLARPYELAPNLADGMPQVSEDGRRYTIRLRPGVHFVDDPAFDHGLGREVRASDVVFSLMRHFDPAQLSQGTWLWLDRIEGLDAWGEQASAARARGEEPDYSAPVAGLKALDDHTVEIRLTRPYPQLVHTLAMGFAAVLPPEALDHHGRNGLQRHAVGSGPFRLLSFTPQRVLFETNTRFRDDPVDLAFEGYDEKLHGHLGLAAIDGRSPPFIDRLEIDAIEEASTRWHSFTAGNEIQYTTMPPEQVDSVLATREPLQMTDRYEQAYFWRASPEAGFIYANFNLAHPAIGYNDDPQRAAANHALRCAIRKAFDWNARNRQFYAGLGEVSPGVIPPLIEGFNPEFPIDSIERDVAGARQLLLKHNWHADNLPVLEYAALTGVRNRQMFEQMRAWLEEIGYPPDKVRLRSFANFGDFNRAVVQGELMMFGIAWIMSFPDALNTLQLYYGPNAAPGSNSANMRHAEFDRLYDRAAVLRPGAERNDLLDRMNRIVIDECVNIAALTRTHIELWHREVIMQPDRETLGGFFVRFVDLAADDH